MPGHAHLTADETDRLADWTTRYSLSRRRRVVAKSEWVPGRGAHGANPRFVATSLKANVRIPGPPHWRRWLGAEHRCVVPFTSFAEHELQPNGSRPPVRFALDETRPLALRRYLDAVDLVSESPGGRDDQRPS